MRILIVGPGVIGHIFARGFSRGGHDVTLLGRDDAALERLQRQGVEFVDLRSGRSEHVTLNYASNVGSQTYDLAILALRNDHLTEELVTRAACWVSASGRLLVFQLGFSGPALLQSCVSAQRALLGYAISTGGFWDVPGTRLCVDVPPGKNTAIGSLGEGITESVKEVSDVFFEAGFECQRARMPDNVYHTSALVAALAAFDKHHPELLRGHASAEDRSLLAVALSEALQVADRLCPRPRKLAAQDLSAVGTQQASELARLGPVSRTLLLRYFRGSGVGEIEKLHEDIVHAAHRHGVPIPTLNRLMV